MNRHLPPTAPQGGHRYVCRVYYEDTDAAGVVYHANFLRLAERARTEALRSLDIPHAEMTRLHGVIFMVRRAKLDYLAPAIGRVPIAAWPSSPGARANARSR